VNRWIVASTVAALLLAGSWQAAAAGGRIVIDPLTGFAAAGFDPVAYFAEDAARPGSTRYEAVWQGATWRFANQGNKAAFLDHPEIYAPAFGGHCAVAVARGYMAEGDPTIWEVHADRLYFFHSESNREVFLAGPGQVIAEADAVWRGMDR
jgi:YHS domain-containing protein